MCLRWVSNPVPSAYKADALPFELQRPINSGPAEIRTPVTGFKVPGPDHWTTGPFGWVCLKE